MNAISWGLFALDMFGKKGVTESFINDESDLMSVEIEATLSDMKMHHIKRIVKRGKKSVKMELFLDGKKAKSAEIEKFFNLELFFVIFNPYYLANLQSNSKIKEIKNFLSKYFGKISNIDVFKGFTRTQAEFFKKVLVPELQDKTLAEYLEQGFYPDILLDKRKNSLRKLKEDEIKLDGAIDHLKEKQYEEIEIPFFDMDAFEIAEKELELKLNHSDEHEGKQSELNEILKKINEDLLILGKVKPKQESREKELDKIIFGIEKELEFKRKQHFALTSELKDLEENGETVTCPNCAEVIDLNEKNKLKLKEKIQILADNGQEMKKSLETAQDELGEVKRLNNLEFKELSRSYKEKEANGKQIQKDLQELNKARIAKKAKREEDLKADKESFELLKSSRDSYLTAKTELKAMTKNKNEDIAETERIRLEKIAIIDKISILESEINILKTFNVMKVELLSSSIKKHFNNVDIEFFKTNKDGEIVEKFNILFNGKTTEKHSTSEQIECGIEISTALNKINNCKYPLFVDKVEAFPGIEVILPQNNQVLLSEVIAGTKLTVERL